MFSNIKSFFNKFSYGPEAFLFTDIDDNVRVAILQPRNVHFINFNKSIYMYTGKMINDLWECIKFSADDSTMVLLNFNPGLIDASFSENAHKVVINQTFNSETDLLILLNKAIELGVFSIGS